MAFQNFKSFCSKEKKSIISEGKGVRGNADRDPWVIADSKFGRSWRQKKGQVIQQLWVRNKELLFSQRQCWWYRGASLHSLQGCADLPRIALELEEVDRWINPLFASLKLPCRPSTSTLFSPAEQPQFSEKAPCGPQGVQLFRARAYSIAVLSEGGKEKKQYFDKKMPKSFCCSRDATGVQIPIATLFQ